MFADSPQRGNAACDPEEIPSEVDATTQPNVPREKMYSREELQGMSEVGRYR